MNGKNEEYKIEIIVSKTLLYSQRKKGSYKARIQCFIKGKEIEMKWDYFSDSKYEAYFKAYKAQEDYFCKLLDNEKI